MQLANLITIIFLIGVFLVLSELIARFTKISKIVMRKIVHVALCFLIIWLSYLYGYKIMIWVGLFYTLAFTVLRLFPNLQSVRSKSDASWGEVLFPVGVALSAFVAIDYKSFAVALLILALSDTIAYVAGKGLERWTPVIIPGRTLAGSTASFLMTVLILLFAGYDLWVVLQVSIAVGVAELFSRNGLDNISMPVTAALVIRLLS